MMQCGAEPAGTFKTMAEDSGIFKTISVSENTKKKYLTNEEDGKTRRRLSFPSENSGSKRENPGISPKVLTLQNVPDDSNPGGRVPTEMPEQLSHLKAKNTEEFKCVSSENQLNLKQNNVNITEEKENTAMLTTTTTISTDNATEEGASGPRALQDSRVADTEDRDATVVRRAREEGHVNVVFPGPVSQDGCCRFVSEILKCILYQRQQLPMTYDQLVYSQKKLQASMQDKDVVSRRPAPSADMDWRKCQQTLQDLEEVLQQLEALFSLSRVPRVLLLLGGSLVLPKELYEVNLEDLEVAGGDQCLRVSSCLRQLFRTLFVADLLSDSKPVRLMATAVLVLAHRDCGVGWFRPKLQFKVPTRVKNQVIVLSSDPDARKNPKVEESDWQDYVWFQAPLTIKGFGK